MGRERDESSEPEAEPEFEPEAELPAGDSAGTYYLSIEAFESRLPRQDASEAKRAEDG